MNPEGTAQTFNYMLLGYAAILGCGNQLPHPGEEILLNDGSELPGFLLLVGLGDFLHQILKFPYVAVAGRILAHRHLAR